MVLEKINPNENLRKSYPKINAAIDAAEKADGNASVAKTTAEQAVVTANSVQEQFNQVVIEGDSSVEAAQARVKADGTSFTTLKDRLDDTDAQLADIANSVLKYGADPTGVTDSTQAFIDATIAGKPIVFIPVGKYRVNVDSIVLPMGVSLIGATDCFYQHGTGATFMSILIVPTATSTSKLITMLGGNHVKNIAVVYESQTYNSTTMIDTGITFLADTPTSSTDYSKGNLIEGVSVCGGTTVLESIENADYLSINRLSFTPNYIRPSIIISNAYDLVRNDHIQCNQNVTWMFKNSGLIPSNFSTDILAFIEKSGEMMELGRVDELMLNNPFSFGVAYPITLTTVLGVQNGGITLNNAVFDKTYRVLTIDADVTNFGIQINGLKAVFITQSDSCLYHFTNNSQGSRVQATNVYVTSSVEWKPCIFDVGSSDNRVLVTNFNFYNPSSNVDNGIGNAYSAVNGFGGANGLTSINTVPDLTSSFYLLKANARRKVQAFQVAIDIALGATTKTQTFTFPNGAFTDTPIVVASLRTDNVGSKPISVVKVQTVNTDTFVLKWDSTEAATATGIWNVNVIAIGN